MTGPKYQENEPKNVLVREISVEQLPHVSSLDALRETAIICLRDGVNINLTFLDGKIVSLDYWWIIEEILASCGLGYRAREWKDNKCSS